MINVLEINCGLIPECMNVHILKKSVYNLVHKCDTRGFWCHFKKKNFFPIGWNDMTCINVHQVHWDDLKR